VTWGKPFKVDATNLPIIENDEKSPIRKVGEVTALVSGAGATARSLEGLDLYSLGAMILCCAAAYYMYERARQKKWGH